MSRHTWLDSMVAQQLSRALFGAVHGAAAAAVAVVAEVSGLRSIAGLLAGSPTRCDRHTLKGSARRRALLLPLPALPPPCPALNGAHRDRKRIECALARHRTRRRRYWASCLAAGVPPSRVSASARPGTCPCWLPMPQAGHPAPVRVQGMRHSKCEHTVL